MTKQQSYQTDSAATTEAFGHSLGVRLQGGEVIELRSDLGGGKTTLVRGLASGLGSNDHVASPTFTISREYQGSRLTLYHYDFYRLAEDPGLMTEELADALQDPSAVLAVEWSDAVNHVLPAERLTLTLRRSGDDSREITVSYPPRLAYTVEGLAV